MGRTRRTGHEFCADVGDAWPRTFANVLFEVVGLFNKITGRGKRKIQILRDFEGLVRSGEMLVVLGRPGSGCSTLLKTMSGETHGFYIADGSHINYQGMLVRPQLRPGWR